MIKIFIRSMFIALIAACLIGMSDLIFISVSPKAFISFRNITVLAGVPVLAMNWLLVFFATFILVFVCSWLGGYVVAGIFSLWTIFYLISWGTYLVVGEFLGFEGIRFVWYNLNDILWMMGQISAWYWVALTVLVLTPVAGFLLTNRFSHYFKKIITALEVRQRVVAGIGVLVLCTLMAIAFILFASLTPKQKADLRLRVSPQATLFWDRPQKEILLGRAHDQEHLRTHYSQVIGWEDYQKMQVKTVKPVPVIVIVIESMCWDVLNNAQVMPNTYALKQDGVYLRAYTTSNQSDYAWPAIFSSQYPLRTRYHYYYPRESRFPRVTIYDVLKQQGFDTAIYSAQNETWGGMFNYLNTGSLDMFYYSDASHGEDYMSHEDSGFAAYTKKFRSPGKIDDGVVVDEAISWIKGRHQDKFFLGLNFQRSHFPYTWPDSFHPPDPGVKPSGWGYSRTLVKGVKARYFSALRYTDEQIGRFINFLKEQGIYEKSIIVLMGDHGEAFYEHASPIHGNELFNETALTGLLIKGSNERITVKNYKNPELLDVAPTLSSMLGLTIHPAFQGESLVAPSSFSKPVFITVQSAIAKQDAIVAGGWKLIRDLRNNRTSLFDLRRDPGESKNVYQSNQVQGLKLLLQLLYWRKKQLEYYSTPDMAKKYYAPKYSSP